MRRLAALALVLAAAGVHAQTFTLTATQPADFAAGVALATEVRFTFSEPLAAVPLLVLWPDSAATRGTPALSADGQTAVFPVTLRADTRYVALVPTATAASGARLARPAALNFTTSATAGSLTVSGTVSDGAGAAVDGALVALLTADAASATPSLVALRVLSAAAPSQSYSLGPVPLGLYTVGALRMPGVLTDPTSTTPAAFGLYDPDGDGVPNPVILPFNVNVTLSPLPSASAALYVDDATAAAQAAAPGAVLVAMGPQAVDESGAAPAWLYRFASDTARVAVVQVGLLPLTVPDPAGPAGAPLPRPFADSDVALAAADAAGGAAFRAAYPAGAVTVTMEARPGDVPVWHLAYVATDGATVLGRFGADVDLATGVVLATTDGSWAPPVALPTLALAGAHPSRGAAHVRLSLPAPDTVRLTVVDALGRTVAVLADGPLDAGHHVLTLSGTLAPGRYVVRLIARGHRAILPLTVLR